MKIYDIKDVNAWEQVETGFGLELPCPNAFRKIHLRFNTDQAVAVYISDTEDFAVKTLAAYDHGMFDVKATISASAFIKIEGPEDAAVFVQQFVGNQVIQGGVKPRYTTVEPRGRRNSDYDRMVYLFNLNEKRRDAQLEEEREKLRAEFAATANPEEPGEVVEPEPKPEPKPEPEKEPEE